MKVHNEGRGITFTVFISLAIINGLLMYFFHKGVLTYVILGVSVAFFLIVLNFFRSPYRKFEGDPTNVIIAPADGKIVAIEEVYEPEYFNDKRILVAIFMSVTNVHANWFPVNGTVKVSKHHNGRYLAAFLPKSSTENERSTVVFAREDGSEILVRQIAGAMARRIVTYPEVGEPATVDEHFGFIKFGSRVDLYLPIGTKICVEMNQKVEGNRTIIADFPLKK